MLSVLSSFLNFCTVDSLEILSRNVRKLIMNVYSWNAYNWGGGWKLFKETIPVWGPSIQKSDFFFLRVCQEMNLFRCIFHA